MCLINTAVELKGSRVSVLVHVDGQPTLWYWPVSQRRVPFVFSEAVTSTCMIQAKPNRANIGLILVQCRMCWAWIGPTLAHQPVFADHQTRTSELSVLLLNQHRIRSSRIMPTLAQHLFLLRDYWQDNTQSIPFWSTTFSATVDFL